MKGYTRKICWCCGEEFMGGVKARYCSDACRNQSKRMQQAAAERQKTGRMMESVGHIAIARINRQARKKGTTYGKLVAEEWAKTHVRVDTPHRGKE